MFRHVYVVVDVLSADGEDVTAKAADNNVESETVAEVGRLEDNQPQLKSPSLRSNQLEAKDDQMVITPTTVIC